MWPGLLVGLDLPNRAASAIVAHEVGLVELGAK